MGRKGVFGRTLRNANNGAGDGDDREIDPAGNEITLPADEHSDDGDRPASKRTNPNVEIFRKSFNEQMLRSLQDVSPDRIDASRFQDRLDVGEDLESLKESIRANGQQVPVLLRRVAGDRFEVVYGRRRILACRQLGLQVRAMVVEISDEDAVIAQGLENAARLDSSYIEKALFVAQVTEAGYSSETIEKALDIDKTQVSRMRSVVRDIPRDVISAIGAAHGAGRRPWDQLRALLSQDDAPGQARLLKMIDLDLPSAERLKKLLNDLGKAAAKKARAPALPRPFGDEQFIVHRTGRSISIKAQKSAPEGFLKFLEENMDQYYKAWRDDTE